VAVTDSLKEHYLKPTIVELLSNLEVLKPKTISILFIYLFVVQLLFMFSGSYKFTEGTNPNAGLFELLSNLELLKP